MPRLERGIAADPPPLAARLAAIPALVVFSVWYDAGAMTGVGLHAAQPCEPRQDRKVATVSEPLRVP